MAGPYLYDDRTLRRRMDGVTVFDPRDPDQKSGDPSTWKPTLNAALIFASQYKGFHFGSEFWTGVARIADLCDAKALNPIGSSSTWEHTKRIY